MGQQPKNLSKTFLKSEHTSMEQTRLSHQGWGKKSPFFWQRFLITHANLQIIVEAAAGLLYFI